MQILKLDPQSDTFKISIGLTTGGDDEIMIETRPIMSAMFYLGQSIELPEEIIKQNKIDIAHDETGKPFDWQKVFKGLIHLHSSEERPRNTYNPSVNEK